MITQTSPQCLVDSLPKMSFSWGRQCNGELLLMRILLVLANYYPYIGGAELLFRNLAEGLVQKGHTVKVITRHLPETLLFETIHGVEIERVKVPSFFSLYLFSIVSLPVVIQQASKFDVIHTSSNYSAASAFIGAKMTQRPIVCTVLEVLGQRWHVVQATVLKAWLYRIVENIVVRLPYNYVITISEATHQDLLNASNKNLRGCSLVIYSGIDSLDDSLPKRFNGELRQHCNIPAHHFLYLYFGRPGITKGVEYLLEAVPTIQQNNSQAHLVLILSHDPVDQYQRIYDKVQILKLSGCKIDLLLAVSSRAKLIEYLLDADCIVVPSLTEGFGLTTAEACALKIPIVATQVGSIPEVISGHHVLVKPRSAEAIATGVTRVWRGEVDYTPAKDFSWNKMVAGYEQVYQEVLK